MKKNIHFLLFLLALLLPATALAYDFEVDGIYYNINGNNVTVTYRGTSSWNHNTYSGNVIIPATVTYGGTTYSVTSIGYAAFYGCDGLTSIDIPNSVTTIGDYAFEGSDLISISIPNSVTSIGSEAFHNTPWYNNQPDGLIYVGLVAYSYKGVMTTGTSINLANGTLGIAGQAFIYCKGLTSIGIPNTVTSIGGSAFFACEGLISITIPNSVTSIGIGTFSGCSGLSSIIVDSSNPKYDSRDNCNAIIETSSNTLVYGCKNTVIPNSITSIRHGAFYGCDGLTSIDIPNSVTTIGDCAFAGCSGLTSITIPNSVTFIGSQAFWSCSGLTSIIVENSNPIYDSRKNCNAIIETASNTLIYGCKNTVIPYTVTAIGDEAFYSRIGLTSVEIPNSVTSIGNWAFSSCSDLTSITIGNSVSSIGEGAFGLTNLTSITCLTTFPPTIQSSTFHTYTPILYVPLGSVEAYKAATYWRYFTNIVGIIIMGDVDGDGLVSIADVTFLIDAILNGDYEGVYFESADLNRNGRLDIGDVTSLIDELLNGI